MVFAIPFIAVAAVNLETGTALIAAMMLVMLPGSLLLFVLQEKLSLPEWVSYPVSTLAAIALACCASDMIRMFSSALTDQLGSYLYLLAAGPVLTVSFSKRRVKRITQLVVWDLIYLLHFALLVLVVSAVREYLTYGQLWGYSIPLIVKAQPLQWTFAGLILMGLVLALYSLLRGYHAAPAGLSKKENAEKEADT